MKYTSETGLNNVVHYTNGPLLTLDIPAGAQFRLRTISFFVEPKNKLAKFLWRYLHLHARCTWEEEPIERLKDD